MARWHASQIYCLALVPILSAPEVLDTLEQEFPRLDFSTEEQTLRKLKSQGGRLHSGTSPPALRELDRSPR